eukprot:jgi/Botrbrau1/11649/Bobra.168_2s0006.1
MKFVRDHLAVSRTSCKCLKGRGPFSCKAISYASWQAANLLWGPAQGYLHEGHISLVEAAQANADVVVASIYVNPTQVGPLSASQLMPLCGRGTWPGNRSHDLTHQLNRHS